MSSRFSFLGRFLEHFSLKKTIESRADMFLETHFKSKYDFYEKMIGELSDPRKK